MNKEDSAQLLSDIIYSTENSYELFLKKVGAMSVSSMSVFIGHVKEEFNNGHVKKYLKQLNEDQYFYDELLEEDYPENEAHNEHTIAHRRFMDSKCKQVEKIEMALPFLQDFIDHLGIDLQADIEKHKKETDFKLLRWTGPKVTLANIFYQLNTDPSLSEQGNKLLLDSSKSDIQRFLKRNFDCFNDVSEETMRSYFKSDDLKREQPQKPETTISLKKGYLS